MKVVFDRAFGTNFQRYNRSKSNATWGSLQQTRLAISCIIHQTKGQRKRKKQSSYNRTLASIAENGDFRMTARIKLSAVIREVTIMQAATKCSIFTTRVFTPAQTKHRKKGSESVFTTCEWLFNAAPKIAVDSIMRPLLYIIVQPYILLACWKVLNRINTNISCPHERELNMKVSLLHVRTSEAFSLDVSNKTI